jgi:hypothetical protein
MSQQTTNSTTEAQASKTIAAETTETQEVTKETKETPVIDLMPKEGESKSAFIRRMHFTEGLPIKDISKRSGILYQMVRNIVRTEEDKRLIQSLQSKA